jgi:hypothetical protein
MSMFATSSEQNYDGLSIASLPPSKYEKVKLSEVKFGQADKQDGAKGKWILTFLFKTPTGDMHQHTEWEIQPQDKDAEKKSGNMLKRVGHIMSKFISKDQLAQQSPTFVDYGNWVISKFANTPGYKEQEVDILVVGNVYNGVAKSQFPGYPPFIAIHGNPLQFDNNGVADNKAYYTFMEKKTGSAPDADGAAQPNSGGVDTSASPKADF